MVLNSIFTLDKSNHVNEDPPFFAPYFVLLPWYIDKVPLGIVLPDLKADLEYNLLLLEGELLLVLNANTLSYSNICSNSNFPDFVAAEQLKKRLLNRVFHILLDRKIRPIKL